MSHFVSPRSENLDLVEIMAIKANSRVGSNQGTFSCKEQKTELANEGKKETVLVIPVTVKSISNSFRCSLMRASVCFPLGPCPA
jgi:hypothetical protein